MLFRPLDSILGTTTKVQILRALITLESAVTGREAQRLARVRSTVGAMTALSELTVLGILLRGGSPSTHQYRVNRAHELELSLRALFEAERQRMAVLERIVEEALSRGEVRALVRSVVLFGSQARGDARPESDLDLLFILHAYRELKSTDGDHTRAADLLVHALGYRADAGQVRRLRGILAAKSSASYSGHFYTLADGIRVLAETRAYSESSAEMLREHA